MNSAAVFVDTGAWLAGLIRRDQHHSRAVSAFEELRRQRTGLWVTELVLAELHVHLLRALGPQMAAELIERVKSDPLVHEVFVDPDVQRAALTEWLQRFTDQPFTLTDAVSFAVMTAQRIRTAFTFDRHFSVAGFRVVPKLNL